ncbi:MAG: hypothetical protein C4520_13480 [Candidatus Abyssobacteria bacterium SURF_5]|uniref:Uncharacterized protein n=1 Tax=Abyssobacteria bacterium (strain SURF_5) TaxID=2093360 RepID=A0A3A4NUD1_ABYX5|nr:MAG: hypothetical protein C4520_13480 [Candidatus Abyssubacteria bacterium SURF_5]
MKLLLPSFFQKKITNLFLQVKKTEEKKSHRVILDRRDQPAVHNGRVPKKIIPQFRKKFQLLPPNPAIPQPDIRK